jgi:hypothetical protein
MSPNGIGLANTAILKSLIEGLIGKGVVTCAEASTWLNNAVATVEKEKVPGERKDHALAIIRKELLPMIDADKRPM